MGYSITNTYPEIQKPHMKLNKNRCTLQTKVKFDLQMTTYNVSDQDNCHVIPDKFTINSLCKNFRKPLSTTYF